MVDLNAFKLSSAMKMVAGTARSMVLMLKVNFGRRKKYYGYYKQKKKTKY